MANQEHLDILLRSAKSKDGMREWNQWRQANLGMVPDLSEANLSKTDLSGVDLYRANLKGAFLKSANLSGANLRYARLDLETNIAQVVLSPKTELRDIMWNGVDLTPIDWEPVTHLGDDTAKDNDGKPISASDKARANRQVATRLREQSLSEDADRFAYHARVWQRRSLREKRKRRIQEIGVYLGSLFLDLLAGYGYRPARTLLAYALVIVGFSLAFMQFGVIDGHSFSFHEASIFSLTSFHGRGFFPGGLSLDDPITTIAAIEAVIGLVIEVSFIATFTQRFFGR